MLLLLLQQIHPCVIKSIVTYLPQLVVVHLSSGYFGYIGIKPVLYILGLVAIM